MEKLKCLFNKQRNLSKQCLFFFSLVKKFGF